MGQLRKPSLSSKAMMAVLFFRSECEDGIKYNPKTIQRLVVLLMVQKSGNKSMSSFSHYFQGFSTIPGGAG